jgi:septal ring factor EnvC (AmiA/AmiB activator)
MSATPEDLSARLDRVERDLRRVADDMALVRVTQSERSDGSRETVLSRVSFRAWLEITGPTFATMVLGFTLVWSQIQTLNAQTLEVTRTLGRLEGSLGALEKSVAGLQATTAQLQATTAELQASNAELRGAIGELQVSNRELRAAVDRLTERVDRIAR